MGIYIFGYNFIPLFWGQQVRLGTIFLDPKGILKRYSNTSWGIFINVIYPFDLAWYSHQLNIYLVFGADAVDDCAFVIRICYAAVRNARREDYVSHRFHLNLYRVVEVRFLWNPLRLNSIVYGLSVRRHKRKDQYAFFSWSKWASHVPFVSTRHAWSWASILTKLSPPDGASITRSNSARDCEHNIRNK